MSKIRIYDLAKELKLDNKKIMDEVRRLGYDVRVASNSVPDDIAEKVRNLYFPKRATPAAPVKLMKGGHVVSEAVQPPPSVTPPRPVTTMPKLIKGVRRVESPTLSTPSHEPEPPSTEIQPLRVVPLAPPPQVTPPVPVPRTLPTVHSIQPPPPVPVQPEPPVVVPPPPISASPVQVEAPAKAPEPEVTTTRVIRIEPPAAPPVTPPVLPSVPSQEMTPQPAPVSKTVPAPTVREISVPKPPPPPVEPKVAAPPPQHTPSVFQIRPITPPPVPPMAKPAPPPPAAHSARPAPPTQRPTEAGTHTDDRRFPPRGQAPARRPQGEGDARRGGEAPRPGQPREASSEATPAPAPTRTTYIPPKDQKGRNDKPGARRPGGGGKETRTDSTNKREQHERDLRLRPTPTKLITPAPRPTFTELKPIRVPEGTTVKELAEKLEVKPKDVVALILTKGLMVTINQAMTEEMMREVGREFGFEVSIGGFEEMVAEQEITEEPSTGDADEDRAPVVAVMGHVDHGKTSLLDAIRNTRVAAGEAGGITQHIGAYSVEVPDPDDREKLRRIVFLDTPGHEAFTLMRARGAKGADVAVIVVAADDGVMPQTIEAIDHARAASVPMVVAINKIDKPEINIDRVKKELADHGLLWDGWGGDTVMVEISAKQRINLESLLEMIILTTDILELKANSKRLASGVVLEARLDRGRGPVASVLVQQGTLNIGDPIIAGLNFGRVRALFDDRGRNVQSAGPAIPVEILGLQGVPKAGDLFQVVTDAAKAQEVATWRQSKHRIAQLSSSAARGLEDVFEQMKAGKLKELLVILKADVQGSVEVLRDTLEKLSSERVKVRVIRADVGAITESDVLLASASNDMAHTCVIIGFNVRPAPRVSELAKQEKVDIRMHSIIYKVEEEMRKAMIGMLDPTLKEVQLGRAEVRQVIKIPKVGNVAGCMVTDGVIKRTAQVRVLRDNTVIFEGHLSSLRRFKDDTSEVKTGFECGIGVERFNDIKPGDVLEVFTTEKVLPTEL
ncbi:MAG TPA: translation initiation factor IF-2 [Acidobacteriota bacterium]|nr:translation initiation factor IF-2 [Acidobacteriota bacterium]